MKGGKTMNKYDLYRKCNIVQRAFEVLWAQTGIIIIVDDVPTSYSASFIPENQVARLRHLGLTPIPGLGRRPILNAIPVLPKRVAANVRAAVLLHVSTV